MQGYQLTFFTQQDRVYKNQPLAQWLLEQAKALGIRGATVNGSLQGLGHDGAIHAINMFDLSDQPVQVTMVLSEDEVQPLFTLLEQEHITLFYMKSPVEFGTLGAGNTEKRKS
jgi:PII-like signaling protein